MAMTEPAFATLETAYWEWVDKACPFPQGSSDRAKWMKSNRFEFEGVEFTRTARPIKSNSGKTVVAWQVTFRGIDGTVIKDEPVRNRRNDPDRNWGLGRD